MNFAWAKSGGSSGPDKSNSVTVDPSGNVYSIGYFNATVAFGATNLTSNGNEDVFVTKFDASGNFIWAKNFGGSGVDIGSSIVTDGLGNLFITGSFHGTAGSPATFGGFNLVAVGSYDIFVCKLSASTGTVTWAKTMGGDNKDEGISIGLDPANNIYIGGNFRKDVDFDPGVGSTILSTNASNSDVFVVKLDASGNFVWAKRMGCISSENDETFNINVTANGVLVTGYFRTTGTVNADFGSTTLTSNGSEEIYVCKLDLSGNFVWAKGMGSNVADNGSAVAADASGNVYLTGYFQNTVDFDPGAGTFNVTVSANNDQDIFLLKLDASGNFVWVKTFGGVGADYGYSVALDPTGDIYLAGSFKQTVDFDPGAGVSSLTAKGNSDLFILKLDFCGNFIWVKQIGGTANDVSNDIDSGDFLTVDTNGYIYLTGAFKGTVDFDPGAPVFSLTSNAAFDFFVEKLTTDYIKTTITGTTPVCKNTTATYSVVPNTGSTYQWSITPVTGGNGTFVGGSTGSSVNINWTTPGTATVTVIETTANACVRNSVTYTVTVNALPTATISGTSYVCPGASGTITINFTGTQPWTVTYTDGTTQTTLSGITSPTLIFTVPVSTTTTYSLVSVSDANCTGTVSGSAVFTVSPPVITTQPSLQTDCKGNKVDFTVLASGIGSLSYQWQYSSNNGLTWTNSNISGTYLNITNYTTNKMGVGNIGVGGANGENLNGYQYRVIITDGNGCTITSNAATLTVNEISTISSGSTSITSSVICQGSSFSWTAFTSGSSPISYQWFKGGTALSDGTVNGAVISGSNTSTLTVTNASLTETGNYTVEIYFNVIDGSGVAKTCHITSGLTRSVTVNPKAFINSMTATTCSSVSFSSTPVNGTNGTVPASTTYSWSAPTVTGGITGGASGSGASSITGTLTNPTNTAQTATYTITPSTVTVIGVTPYTCIGSTFTLAVTIDPKPTITAMTATTCSGIAFSATPLNGNDGVVPAGTTYSWSAPAVTGGMTGGASGSGASSITGTLNNSTSVAQTATYTVTPLSGSCTGTPFSVTVTINPKPTPIITHN